VSEKREKYIESLVRTRQLIAYKKQIHEKRLHQSMRQKEARKQSRDQQTEYDLEKTISIFNSRTTVRE